MSLDVSLQTDPGAISDAPVMEARRQIEICNACRYCEGFCSVFPAITRDKVFADGDITQLANLCHNCRGCYYACQYTAPHEFDLNLPRALATARVESWERLAWPQAPARLFQRHATPVALMLVASLALLFWLVSALPGEGDGFYAWLSHGAMVAIFTPAFLLPLVSIGVSLRRYWAETGGGAVTGKAIAQAIRDAGRLRNLSGGQGQGCNFEKAERFSDSRRHAHQAVMYGFLLCFAATASGTVLHYIFDAPAPYGFWSLPKLLGVPGGLLLVAGCAFMLVLRRKADPALGAPGRSGGENAFIWLLGLTGLTGLILYALRGSDATGIALAIHLGTVLALFLLLPFSKMAHGFYRFAALVRDAGDRQR